MKSKARIAAVAVALSVTIFGAATTSQAQGCALLGKISEGAEQIYTSALEPQFADLIAYRSGTKVKVARVRRTPAGVSIEPKISVDVPDGATPSFAFSGTDLAVSFSMIAAPGGAAFETPSDSSLNQIRFYRLSDGALNSARSFSRSTLESLPPKSTSAPFYSPNWRYHEWVPPYCEGTTVEPGQLGRVLAAVGESVAVANNAEQHNLCNPNPDYYRYHLKGDGSREMRIARDLRDAEGSPLPYGKPLCQILWSPPFDPSIPSGNNFSTCTGVSGGESCFPITASGAAYPVPPPPPPTPGAGTPTPTPTPQPSPTPQICDVVKEPIPILAREHCPTCDYWWHRLEPGVRLFSSTLPGGSAPRGAFNFPTITDGDLEEGDTPIDNADFMHGPIVAMRGDPTDGGYAIAIDSSFVQDTNKHFGGAFFFGGDGSSRGFVTSFLADSRLGKDGALAPMGAGPDGKPLWALGAPLPTTAEGDELAQVRRINPEIRPEAGHVVVATTDGNIETVEFGAAANDLFGSALATTGNLTDDNQPEVLIGAPGGNYAVISAARERTDTRTNIYRFQGLDGSAFGKQVGSLAPVGLNHADIAVIGSNAEIAFYDISSCLQDVQPDETDIQRATRLLEDAIRATRNLATAGTPMQELRSKTPDQFANNRVSGVSGIVDQLADLLPRGTTPIQDGGAAVDVLRAKITALSTAMNRRDLPALQLQDLNASIKRLTSEINVYKKKRQTGSVKAKIKSLTRSLQAAKDKIPNLSKKIKNTSLPAEQLKKELSAILVGLRSKLP